LVRPGVCIEQVAGKLQTTVEKSKAEVVRDLYAVKYMDLFLEDSGQPGQYHRLFDPSRSSATSDG
jgi:hypothetical protein